MIKNQQITYSDLSIAHVPGIMYGMCISLYSLASFSFISNYFWSIIFMHYSQANLQGLSTVARGVKVGQVPLARRHH